MRTLNIPMTKAAKDRLNMFRDPEAMALPFDPASIHPFGIRFDRDKLFVTFRDRDVAYLLPDLSKDKKTFPLITSLKENTQVDIALTSVMRTLQDHADQVGRVLAEQKREAERALIEAQTDYEDESARFHREMIMKNAAFWTTDPEMWEAPARMEDFIEASKLKDQPDAVCFDRFDDDLFILRLTGLDVTLTPQRKKSTFSFHLRDGNDAERVQMIRDLGWKPNAVKIMAEIERMRDRNVRLRDPDPILRAVREFQTDDYNVDMYLSNGEQSMSPSLLELNDEVSVKAGRGYMSIVREGISILDVHIYKTGPKPAHKHYFTLSDRHTGISFADDDFQRLGSIYITAAMQHVEPGAYDRFLNVSTDEVAAEAANMNIGYGF